VANKIQIVRVANKRLDSAWRHLWDVRSNIFPAELRGDLLFFYLSSKQWIQYDTTSQTKRARKTMNLEKKEAGFDGARGRQKLRWKQEQFLQVVKRITKSLQYSFLRFSTRLSLSFFVFRQKIAHIYLYVLCNILMFALLYFYLTFIFF